jgi:hypothetical protein
VRPGTRNLTRGDADAIFRINADSIPAVSVPARAYLELLMRACAVLRLGEGDTQVAGYLRAMSRVAACDGEEFQWFRQRAFSELGRMETRSVIVSLLAKRGLSCERGAACAGPVSRENDRYTV